VLELDNYIIARGLIAVNDSKENLRDQAPKAELSQMWRCCLQPWFFIALACAMFTGLFFVTMKSLQEQMSEDYTAIRNWF